VNFNYINWNTHSSDRDKVFLKTIWNKKKRSLSLQVNSRNEFARKMIKFSFWTDVVRRTRYTSGQYTTTWSYYVSVGTKRYCASWRIITVRRQEERHRIIFDARASARGRKLSVKYLNGNTDITLYGTPYIFRNRNGSPAYRVPRNWTATIPLSSSWIRNNCDNYYCVARETAIINADSISSNVSVSSSTTTAAVPRAKYLSRSYRRGIRFLI